ncbi:MAG TPA: malto-oligosyltrehalose trehalohydrolase [Candidatus Lustribacter sp.]|nr:malto-oligosyltrehalose trehalohydrolase [Candidatus Lustribacter sp.]
MTRAYAGRFGPQALERGYRLRLFAPGASRVDLHIDGRVAAMGQSGDWFALDEPSARAGSRYAFAVDGRAAIPDPGSRFQPDGVHAASEIVAADFVWPDDGWRGRPWHEHAIYELHVGTFTFEGTYEAAARKLRELVALGVTAIELMPIGAFPGRRNWGYDGVLPYAPFAGYGRPDDLRRFIAAAHAHGLAVLLDVVYNHFGPEGNYLHALAPEFFNPREQTPWGAAIAVDVPDVRAYFTENAAYWIGDFRFDGLRLDATHAIVDEDWPSFLREVRAAALAACGPERRIALIVENEHNDVTLLDEGFEAQWNDDVEHAAHVLATGETQTYYAPFAADPAGLLGRALTCGFVRGPSSARFPLTAFVGFLQNHDQIGNRAFGERLSHLTTPAALRALTALILLAPSPPLLFMGEEWAASTPFLFFCDFEPDLAQRVAAGRRREFPGTPDPAAVTTFEASQLRWEERDEPHHAAALALTTAVLRARMRYVVPVNAGVRGSDATCERVGATGLRLRWKLADGALYADANLGGEALDGFPERLTGETFFATHGEVYRDGRAPAWSVRWART